MIAQGIEQYQSNQFEAALASLKKAGRLDRGLYPELHQHLAITYYELGIHLLADREFGKALEHQPNNATVLLYAGLNKQSAKKHREAVTLFERAKMASADVAQQADYSAALSHLELGNVPAARSALSRAAKGQSPEIRSDASELLSELGASRRDKPWSVSLRAGLQYDDNVTTDEIDASTGLDDFAIVADAEFAYRVWRDQTSEIEVGYDFSSTTYFELDDFSLMSHSLSVAASREFRDIDYSLNYSYTRTFLGGDDFLGVHSLSPAIGRLWGESLYTTASYVYQASNFSTSPTRDSDTHILGAGFFWFFDSEGSYLHGGLGYEDEHTRGPEFEYAGYNLNVGLRLALSALIEKPSVEGWDLRFDYRYYNRDYENVTASIGTKRRDQRSTFKMQLLTRPFYGAARGELSYEFIDSDSNLQTSDFQENIVTVGVRARF